MNADVVVNAAWQFNQAVSLLRSALPRLMGTGSEDLVDEIEETLPAMQEALVALAAEVTS